MSARRSRSRSRPPDVQCAHPPEERGPTSTSASHPTLPSGTMAPRPLASVYQTPVTVTDVMTISPAKRMLNQYLIGDLVGEGSHGKVYLSYAPDGAKVAVKAVTRKKKSDRYAELRKNRYLHRQTSHVPVVDAISSTENKIRTEIAIMKKVTHPNIVKLIEAIDDRAFANVFMVMEYMEGGEVKWRDEQYRPTLTVNQTMRICRDVVLALDYLHHQGIIHRDVKPGNLLWTADRRRVKITDFGVSHFSYAQRLAAAKEAGLAARELSGVDLRGVIMNDADLVKLAGTPSFVAPEVLQEVDSSVNSPAGPSTRSRAGSSSMAGSVHLIPHVNINGLQAELESTSSFSHHDPQRDTAHAHHHHYESSHSSTPGRQPVTKAIDVWALGVVLYCLLFGNVPFPAPPDNPTEYAIYQTIKRGFWEVPEVMGVDRIPTGGRHPKDHDESEGAIVVRLLEKLITPDVANRMTLYQMKRYIWLTRDLPDPGLWQRETSPYKLPQVEVTSEDTSSALSPVRFKWKGVSLARGISAIKNAVRPHHLRSDTELLQSPLPGSNGESSQVSSLKPWGRSSQRRLPDDDIAADVAVRMRTQSMGPSSSMTLTGRGKGKGKEKPSGSGAVAAVKRSASRRRDKWKGKLREQQPPPPESGWQTKSIGRLSLGRRPHTPSRTQSNLSAATSPGSSDEHDTKERERPRSRLGAIPRLSMSALKRTIRGRALSPTNLSPSKTSKPSWRGRNGNDYDPTSEPEPDLPLTFDRRSSSSFVPIRATSFTSATNHHHRSDDIASIDNESRYGYNPDLLTEQDIVGAGGVLLSTPGHLQRSFHGFNGHIASEVFGGLVATIPAALEHSHPGLFTDAISGEVPNVPEPQTLRHINSQGPGSATRSHSFSPLSQLSYQNLDHVASGSGGIAPQQYRPPRRAETTDTWEFSDSGHGHDELSDEDDESVMSVFQRFSDTEEPARRVAGLYDPSPPVSDGEYGDEEDEDDSMENDAPIEVKRRRPSEVMGAEALETARQGLRR